MGALIAVLNKKGKNAIETATTMLKTLKPKRPYAFGIASPSTIKMTKTLDALQNLSIDSPIIIGHAFTKILETDKPQPLKLKTATLVFEGRTYPSAKKMSHAETFARKLQQSHEEAIKTFTRKTEGAFAFAVAENEKLLVGRDPMGIQPFYYGENTNYVALASERKALWKIGIKTVNSFPPGHVALIDEHGFKFKPIKTLAQSKPKQITMRTAAKKLQALLHKSTKERVSGLKEVAVAFSGGLDSSITAALAKESDVDVHLIHVSLGKQPETEHAKEAARALELPIHIHLYKEKDVEKALLQVLWLIEEPDPLKVSIGIPIYWAAETTAKMNTKVLLAGQGADELFGGYKRYVDDYLKHGSEKVRETMFNDIVKLHETNLERDLKICNFHGVELRLPFATWQTARFAAELPTELKIELPKKEQRKRILRQVAKNLGLPRFIAEKPKKALQYTTGVSKTIEKLAKKEDLTIKGYLQEIFQKLFKRIEDDE